MNFLKQIVIIPLWILFFFSVVLLAIGGFIEGFFLFLVAGLGKLIKMALNARQKSHRTDY